MWDKWSQRTLAIDGGRGHWRSKLAEDLKDDSPDVADKAWTVFWSQCPELMQTSEHVVFQYLFAYARSPR